MELRDLKMSRNLSLPKSSRQETLETISRNQLGLVFDPSLFELRPESQRDKGIDFIGEIKQDGLYTNFRFAVQLKSTESVKPQKDGSISYPVETSNINYLFSFGLPGYYILYHYPAKQFYITTVAEVYRSLSTKHRPDQLPKTYKVRFNQVLDQSQIDGIYKETFDNGTLLKKLSAHRINGAGQPAVGFVIDERQDVYSVEQNIAFIDEVGYQLLNKRAFSQIVEIEQRTHPRIKASPTFNMVCGIAYFQRANLFKAIELLKLAQQEIDSLHPEDRSMLSYTLTQAKYLLGILNQDEFKKETAEIVANENAGTFLQLENLYNQFINSEQADEGARIKEYYEGVMLIVDKHPDFHDMRVVAHAKVLDLEATLLLHELAKNLIITMGRKEDAYRDMVFVEWLKFDDQYVHQLQELYWFALKNRDFLALCNLTMDKTEWEFAKIYHFQAFSNWNKETLTIDKKVEEDDRKLLREMLVDVDKIMETYDRLQHRENHFNCLRCKYELLDFLGDKSAMEACAKAMKELITVYEMNALRKSYEQVLSGKMKYRKFTADLAGRRAVIDDAARSSGIYEHLYDDITVELHAVLNRKPKWSLTELLPLTYPPESSAIS
jgi:hypothetical protein